jgi:hypothetical protein
MESISLDSAVMVSNWSRRTWWRRITDGVVSRLADDDRGRTMLPWPAVQVQLTIPFNEADIAVLAEADRGDAAAQNDIGQLLASEGSREASLYWIRQAAEQDYPDAMQLLGQAYAAGAGVQKDDNLALMWIAKAAAKGHIIAAQQIRNLINSAQ